MPASPARALPPWVGTAAALALTLAAALFLVRGPLASFSVALWGPDQPWVHRDFLGAWWLFHAAADPALDLSLQNHPAGALGLRFHIPNPWDAWLLGPWIRPDPAHPAVGWWNRMQMAHHLGNILGVSILAHSRGLRGLALAAAGVLAAASPLMLHELAGGRTLSGVVWPGLVGLALLPRGRGLLAGLLIGVQGLCYIYTGLVVGLVALVLRPCWGLAAAALPMLPYLAWLAPVFAGTHSRPPPADYSVLPLGGLLGLPAVPARQRLLPLLLPAGLVAAALPATPHRRRWLAAVLLALFVALGPTPGAKGDHAVLASPLAWLIRYLPGLGRLHHPVRAGLVAVPLLAVLAGLGLHHSLSGRARSVAAAVLIGLALALGGPVDEAAAHSTPRPLPGLAAARWLRDHADDVDAISDLTGSGAAALGLQPVHGRPMLEGLRRPQPKPGAGDPGTLRRALDAALAGGPLPPPAALRAAGISHLLAVDRPASPLRVPTAALRAAYGPPVAPGIWALP